MFILAKIKEWFWYIGAVVSIAGSIYVRGWLEGRKKLKDNIAKENEKARVDRERIDNEVKNADGTELDKRASRWVRD